MQQKIVITGGPGTGKSTVIEELANRNYACMFEISREITLNARKNGIEQLFLTKPLLFSELLLEGRINQYIKAEKKNNDIVFFDRGIPDIHAYMNYISVDYPNTYISKSKMFRYDYVFLMDPWKDIFISDNERYENFEQSLAIHNHLKRAYNELGYNTIDVPFDSVNNRANFILKSIT